MVKGTFGLVKSKSLAKSDRTLNRQIKSQIRRLQKRRKQLIKQGEYTAERRSYFNERISELKKALK